jgi:hypothetical protein
MKKIIIISILLIATLALNSQTLEYNLQKPQKLFIGTPFHVLVDITTSLQDSIFAPQIDTLDIFILKNMTAKDEIEKDVLTTSIDLEFQPFDTGEFTFPALEFAVKTTDGMTFLKTNEFQLTIESIIADSTQIIADIADPLSVNLGFWDYVLPLLIITLIVLGIIFLVKYLNKRKTGISEPIIIDDRPPYQIVLELLDKLKREKLLDKGDFLHFHFRISFLLRLFIELQFKVNAVEMTTNEIRSNFNLDDFKEKSQILDFLTFADKIKFAKFIPKTSESESALNWLESYLKNYKAEAGIKTESKDSTQEIVNA